MIEMLSQNAGVFNKQMNFVLFEDFLVSIEIIRITQWKRLGKFLD